LLNGGKKRIHVDMDDFAAGWVYGWLHGGYSTA
jgi:hypothetical protein